MSDHEDILMGLDAVSDRLNDADQLVRATRASYLQVAQRNFSLLERMGKASELADYMASNPDHFTTVDVRDYAENIRDVLDGSDGA